MVARKKSETERKTHLIRFVATEEQHALIASAAARAGLQVGPWLRALALREAKREAGR